MIKHLIVSSLILSVVSPVSRSFKPVNTPPLGLVQSNIALLNDNVPVDPNKDPIKLETTTYSVDEHETVQIVYSLEGLSPQATVTFRSENSEIASVSQTGLVTGKSSGSTNVSIVVVDGLEEFTKQVVINVRSITGAIKFSQTDVSMERGTQQTLEYTLDGDQLAGKPVLWTTSDPKVAEVSKGVVTAKGSGKATITASIGDVTANVIVNVKVSLRNLEFNPSSVSLVLDDSVELPRLIYVPYDTTVYRNPHYSIVDSNIVAIEDGKIIAKSIGTTQIKATIDGIEAELSVTVKPKQTDSGADILKVKEDKRDGNTLYLSMQPFEKGDKKRYSITLSDPVIKDFINGKSEAKIVIELDDILLADNMEKLENLSVPVEVMNKIDKQKVTFELVNKQKKPKIAYNFFSSYSNSVDLRYHLTFIEQNSPLYPLINGRAYDLMFANLKRFPVGTRVDISSRELESSVSQMHFFYELIGESNLEYTKQDASVTKEGTVSFEPKGSRYIVTFNMISSSNDDVIIVGLLIAVLTVGGGSGYYYYDKMKKRKKL